MIHNSLFSKLHRLFFYLLILLLPTQLGLHFWPDWALVLGRRIDYLSPTLYVTDILIVFMLISWGADWISGITNHESRIMNKPKRFSSFWETIIHNSCLPAGTAFFIILTVLACINIVNAASVPVAIYHWMKVLEFALLGVYIMRTKPDVFLITRLLSVAVLYSSVLAIWQFILQHSVGGIFWWLGERVFTTVSPGIAQTPLCFPMFRGCPLVLRSYATFPHPNVLGGFLAVTLPLIINLQISKSTNLRMNETVFIFFKWIAIGLGITALVLTFSRSAWIVGFLGMFMVHRSWFMEKRKNKTVSFMTAIVFILLAFAVIFYSLFVIHNSYEESVVVRLALNESALSMWKQYSLLGVGLGNFLVVLPSVLPSRIIYFLQPVHNIYLLLLSEIGVIGICLFLLLGVYFVKHELRIMNYGKTKERHVLFSIIHYSLFAILLLGFVDHYPLSLQQGRLFFTLLISLNLVPQFRYK